MGCCLSNNKGSPHEKESHSQVGLDQSKAPPSSTEEETVKEVLSETPKLKKAHIFIPQQQDVTNKTQIKKPAMIVKKIQEMESLDKFNVKTEPKSHVIEDNSASEEVSQICSASLSESLSTVTDKRNEEDDEVMQQRDVLRSGSRNRVVGRSPNRKLDQSPKKRNAVVNGGSHSSVRLVQQRGSRPDPTRKDPGESSGRRSRSPAVMVRSPSGKRTTRSPSRVGRDPREQQQHGTTTAVEGKWPSRNNNNNNESLENPLVSLECFIFL